MSRCAIAVVILQLLGVTHIGAQSAEDLVVSVSVHMTRAAGGEDPPGMFLTTGPLDGTTPGSGRFSMARCGAMSMQGRAEGAFPDGAIAGWRVEMFPVRVAEGAATFRLKWARALDAGKDANAKREDIELTMRPGDSRPMDIVAIPVDKETGRRCAVWDNRGQQVEYSHVSLRVSVAYRTFVMQERRLVGAELWLIERLPTGGERTQSLTVRGLPHREIPFYFDAIRENAHALEIFGSVVVRPEAEGATVEVLANSRWGPATFDWRDRRYDPVRQSESRLRVGPGETVELSLAKLADSVEPFTARRYAIRIRTQQLR